MEDQGVPLVPEEDFFLFRSPVVVHVCPTFDLPGDDLLRSFRKSDENFLWTKLPASLPCVAAGVDIIPGAFGIIPPASSVQFWTNFQQFFMNLTSFELIGALKRSSVLIFPISPIGILSLGIFLPLLWCTNGGWIKICFNIISMFLLDQITIYCMWVRCCLIMGGIFYVVRVAIFYLVCTRMFFIFLNNPPERKDECLGCS